MRRRVWKTWDKRGVKDQQKGEREQYKTLQYKQSNIGVSITVMKGEKVDGEARSVKWKKREGVLCHRAKCGK